MLHYKKAVLSDLNWIVEIYNSTVPGKTVTADTEPVTVESRRSWFEKHDARKRPLWIVESEKQKAIGWVSLQSFYGRPAYDATAEVSIYLEKGQRGSGYGKMILKHCMEQAPEMGIKTLLGFIFAHNIPSLNLFKSLGFEEWGTLPRIALLGDEEKDLKILGKRLVR